MDSYIALGIATGAICASWYALSSEFFESIETGFKAKYALRAIAEGDDPREYRDLFQDVKLTSSNTFGLSSLIMGGKKAMLKSLRENRRS